MKATTTKKNSVKRSLAGILATVALATAFVPTFAANGGFANNGITASAAYIEMQTAERDKIDAYLKSLNEVNDLTNLLVVNDSTQQTTQQELIRDDNGNVYSIYKKRKLDSDGKNAVENLDTTMFGISRELQNTIYPGALLVADADMITGSPETIQIQRRNVNVCIAGSKMKEGKKLYVDVNPTRASYVEQGTADILADLKEGADFVADTKTKIEKVESESQIKAKMNFSQTLWGELKINAETNYQTKQQAVVLDLNQIFYTESIDNIASSDLFADSVTLDQVKAAVQDRPTAYVSSVNYGKRIIAMIQTDDMSFDLKAAVSGSGVGKKVTLDAEAEYSNKLAKCTVKLIVLGGSSENSGKFITTDMTKLLEVAAASTKYDGYAAPISFSTCNSYNGKLLTKNYTCDAWDTVIAPVRSAVKTKICFGGISNTAAMHSKTVNIYGKRIKGVDEKGNYVYGDEEKLYTKTVYADGVIDWTLNADVDFGSVRVEFLHDADKISNGTHLLGVPFETNGGISAPIKQNIYLKNLLADPDKTGVIDTLYIGAVNVGTNVGGITIRRSDNQEDSEYSRGADLAFNLKYGLHLAKHPDDAIYAHDMVYQPQIGYATLSLKGENSLARLSRMIVINNY